MFNPIKLEKPTVSFGGVTSYSLNETPEEIQNLEKGYYSVDGFEFRVEKEIYSNVPYENILFPMSQKGNPIMRWIDAKWEKEQYEKDWAEAIEINEWINDLNNPLIFGEDGKAHLKKWNGKEIYIEKSEIFDGIYDVFVDNKPYIDLWEHEDGYSCHDGYEFYRKSSNPKIAIGNMLESCFPSSDGYEQSCSSCGDGGCFHCEPHRFI
jgi:hypothetical protein